MPEVRVSTLAESLKAASLVRGGGDVTISSVTNDSREVRPGALYAALPGEHVDGHRFIDEAITGGATAILCSHLPGVRVPGVAYLVAEKPRLALSEVSHVFYGRPSHEIEVVGVTGTDGKTSTTHYLYQLLSALGAGCSFLSTAAMAVGGDERPNMLHQSTPEAPEVHRALRRMVDSGSDLAVLESSSHGLSALSCRLAHVRFHAAILTNITHDHLEFHGTFNRYRHDKANLFRALGIDAMYDHPDFDPGTEPSDPPDTRLIDLPNHKPFADGRIGSPFGVAHRGDPNGAYAASVTDAPVLSYAVDDPNASIHAERVELDATGSRFDLCVGSGRVRATLPIPGGFTILNVLAASATAIGLTGCSLADLVEPIGALKPPNGRLAVLSSKPFTVVVDHASTPGAFRAVLPFFKQQAKGRLIVVFGSAGERDPGKRPIQGGIADRYADVIVLTDEDPRSEPPMSILEQIASGFSTSRDRNTVHQIPDRRMAIRKAFSEARAGDIVLLLGKGHETSIIRRDGADPWNEINVATEELAGYLADYQ